MVVRCPWSPATFWVVILHRMSDIAQIPSAIEQGDTHAAEQLLLPVHKAYLRAWLRQALGG
jgi:hypothetical protein